ncbi:MAG TPA: 8-amino-7-oxononanoate synthase, partial [Cyanobacteria bacterium UBA11153]|nr:8-amino-7-oxononanoate synthase [Cyanobacteria bacterium UBA11153]
NYNHNNIQDLQTKLEQHRQQYRRCLITTDSVFSMDGDLCPLPEIIAIANSYHAMLLVDEAHATGVLGKTGAGCVEHFDCTGNPIIQVGTLSKALASLGGYVAGSSSLIDFLRNRAATWIYTTALSPADTAAALAAIQISQEESQRRIQLFQNIHTLKKLLKSNLPHLKLLPSESPILCLEFTNATAALKAGKKLKEAGIFAPAIRPPTVPTSRIRISVIATNQLEDIQQLVSALENIG